LSAAHADDQSGVCCPQRITTPKTFGPASQAQVWVVCTLKQEKTMLDDTLKTQLQQYLGLLRQPIQLTAALDDSETSGEM
jgi:hypothetical protein